MSTYSTRFQAQKAMLDSGNSEKLPRGSTSNSEPGNTTESPGRSGRDEQETQEQPQRSDASEEYTQPQLQHTPPPSPAIPGGTFPHTPLPDDVHVGNAFPESGDTAKRVSATVDAAIMAEEKVDDITEDLNNIVLTCDAESKTGTKKLWRDSDGIARCGNCGLSEEDCYYHEQERKREEREETQVEETPDEEVLPDYYKGVILGITRRLAALEAENENLKTKVRRLTHDPSFSGQGTSDDPIYFLDE